MQRHQVLAVGVGGLIKRWTLEQPLYEQRVPAWDRQRLVARSDGDPVERAILDIEYTDGNMRRWIDVSVRQAAAGSQGVAARGAAARRAGEAARRGERSKHERHPGPQLTAFVIEANGRWGGEARQWLRQVTDDLPTTSAVHSRLGRTGSSAVACSRQSRDKCGLQAV